MPTPRPPLVFLGSSSEGREVARHLQAELGDVCQIQRWDHGVFKPGGFTLDSLIEASRNVDFAVLVATPDDKTMSRGATTLSPRDNIVSEFGLFAGALGRERTYLLATGDLKMPTDVLGLTRLAYQQNAALPAAINQAALELEERIRSLGLRLPTATAAGGGAQAALEREIDVLCRNAVAQGWTVRTNSPTTLRLRSPQGRSLALPKSTPSQTREDLRHFAARLRAVGLRVNNSVRRPVEESPF